MADNSRRQLAYIAESTYGTTPGTPQTQLVEFSTFDMEFQQETLTDPSIRADRQTGFARRGNISAGGSLGVAMCPDNYDVFLEAALGGTWTTNVLKVGSTVRSFAVEEGFLDINQFRVFNGVMVNTFSMEVTPSSLVNATFGLMGSTATPFTGTSLDVTPTSITVKDKFFHEGGVIQEGGSTVANITAINFQFTNNLSGNYALGNTGYRSISMGKVEVTGTVTALFESVALYNKFRNNTDSSLSFTLTAGSPAETINWTFPKVKYTTGSLTRGDTGPVLVQLGFTAVYDSSSSTSLTVTRSA